MFLAKNYYKAYILGIGGSSMQAIAKILCELNIKVYGSDSRYDSYYNKLTELGVEIDLSPCIDKIKQCDIVIYSGAIKDTKLLDSIKALGVKLYSRKQFIALCQDNFDKVIAVSGTHGKSTTTYLISSILLDAGKSATYHIGASSNKFQCGGLHLGNEYLVSEACEYQDSFLSFKPYIAVILNIEYDHPDYFTSKQMLYNSFLTFASNIKSNGYLIINASLYKQFNKYLLDINRKDITIISVGSGGEYTFSDVKIAERTSYTLYHQGEKVGDFTTTLNGYYNIYNNIISIIVAKLCGISYTDSSYSLQNISYLSRRFEPLGTCNGANVFTDYAHHPSEIYEVIKATKQKYNCNLVVCFQPHTYSRTTALFDDFVKCFKFADSVIITKTYKSRENSGVKSAFDLFVEVAKNQKALYFDDFVQLAKYIKSTLKPTDILLLIGAGNINEVYNLL